MQLQNLKTGMLICMGHNVLITHNSFDGREAVELAKEILKTK